MILEILGAILLTVVLFIPLILAHLDILESTVLEATLDILRVVGILTLYVGAIGLAIWLMFGG